MSVRLRIDRYRSRTAAMICMTPFRHDEEPRFHHGEHPRRVNAVITVITIKENSVIRENALLIDSRHTSSHTGMRVSCGAELRVEKKEERGFHASRKQLVALAIAVEEETRYRRQNSPLGYPSFSATIILPFPGRAEFTPIPFGSKRYR